MERGPGRAQSAAHDDRCTVSVPADISFLPVVQAFVHAAAERLGFSRDDLGDIDVAVEEATSNVILDAFAPGEQATFDVTCERVPAGLAVSFRDRGLAGDPTRVPRHFGCQRARGKTPRRCPSRVRAGLTS